MLLERRDLSKFWVVLVSLSRSLAASRVVWILLKERLQLRCTFDPILAVDIARVVTHIVLSIVQEATFTLHGHSYFVLTLIVPVTVERMSECLSILVTDWALLQMIVTNPLRKAQGILIICTVKARDTFRCYVRTVHSINAFGFMVAFGGAGKSWNTARSWGNGFGGTFGWAINPWSTLSRSCCNGTFDTRDAFWWGAWEWSTDCSESAGSNVAVNAWFATCFARFVTGTKQAVEVLTRRTFVSYFHSSSALVEMIARQWVFESTSFAVTVQVRPSVRTAYRRKEVVLSRSSIVLALCLQRPEAVQKVWAEVSSWATLAAYGPPAAVALNVVVAVGGVREVVGSVVRRVAGANWLWSRWTREVRTPWPAVYTGRDK